MSSVNLCRSALGIMNIGVLKKALEVIAKEEGIEITDYVTDHYGKRYTSRDGHKILGSLITRELPKGIGVAVDKDGKLIFVGDSYGCDAAFNKMKERIEFTYQKLALIIAAQLAGLNVSVLLDTQKQTILEGVYQ